MHASEFDFDATRPTVKSLTPRYIFDLDGDAPSVDYRCICPDRGPT
jgi:hypothetical protein